MKTISYSDPLFPDEFKKIPDCPKALYALGNTDLLVIGRKMAVIGARKADEVGIEAAYKLGIMYAVQGYTVVSGLAFGCDAAAHRGCIDAGGKTIAIVATGLDKVFPKEHKSLQESILATGGLVISEQPPGVKANPSRLVARNRLQAALSDFVVVAQCPAKSGTLYTVDFALRYGRPVFAVDFGFYTEINAGNRQLLSQGVQPIHYTDLCHDLTQETHIFAGKTRNLYSYDTKGTIGQGGLRQSRTVYRKDGWKTS